MNTGPSLIVRVYCANRPANRACAGIGGEKKILFRPQGLADVSGEKRSQGQADGQTAATVDGADPVGDVDLPRHMDPERAALRGGDLG